MGNIVQLKKDKPEDIKPYIDFEKGWKFAEKDKDFLKKYFESDVLACIEEYDGDGLEEPVKILKSLCNYGVEKTRALIQDYAWNLADAVVGDIYNYYGECADALKLIEYSILNIQW